MAARDLVLLQGIQHTRETLESWNRRPWAVLRGWLLGSAAIVTILLLAVYVVARFSLPDLTPFSVIGIHRQGNLSDVSEVLYRNSLVLALHAMACVAGFIAGSSLPLSAAQHSGLWRWVHQKAGPLAIGFVVCATTFSLVTQTYVIGSNTSTISTQLGISPATLLLAYLPHAIPELLALFLPLAAWLIASRRGDWNQLLAATFVTVAIAVPVLVLSASTEVFLSPELLQLFLP